MSNYYRIPGHSGTENKHRKAFLKRGELQKVEALNKKANRKNSKYLQEELINKRLAYEQNSKLRKRINRWLILPIIIISAIAVSFIAYAINDSFTAMATTSNEAVSSNSKADMREAYSLFVENGNYLLDRNRYDEAYRSFVQALKLNNKGTDARIGMTKALIKKCELEGIYCKEKEINLKYLNQKGLL